jgi:serine/threonine-protein kinase RsbW
VAFDFRAAVNMVPTAGPLVREGTWPATLDNLPAMLALLDDAAAAAGLGDDVLFPLHLAVEEACANVIRHGYGAGEAGPLALRIQIDPQGVAVVITDEAPHFDPADAPLPALDADVESRSIGGLGWHLIRQTMDEIHHEKRPNRGNRLTLVKHRPVPLSPLKS